MSQTADVEKEKRRRQKLLLLMIIGLLVCACVLLYDCGETVRGQEIYDDVLERVMSDPREESPGTEIVMIDGTRPTPSPLPTPDPEIVPNIELPKHAGGEVDLGVMQDINDDSVAWLYCEGTVIDYPIVQGGTNNDYLYHTVTGEYSKLGSLFLDYRNAPNFTDMNSTIYGHRMKSGKMFGTLEKYKNQSYYNAHPTMVLYTGDGKTYLVELFCGYVAVDFNTAYRANFANTEAFEAYLAFARARSTFDSTVEVSGSDRILTLSTCTSENAKARYLVLGKLIRAK